MAISDAIQHFLVTRYESQVLPFIVQQIAPERLADASCFFIDTVHRADVLDKSENLNLVFCAPLLNDFTNINKHLKTIHQSLRWGGIFIGRAETLAHHKRCIYAEHNEIAGKATFLYEFIVKRALPKLFGFRYLYRKLQILKHHVMSRCEILGRLLYCGFEIVGLRETDKFLYFIVSKKTKPLTEKPNQGLLIKIKKIGLHGRTINLYKLRTMHAYASYLHDYILRNLKIDNEGKVVHDFRKTGWGKVLRIMWLDELPQVINFLKGEVSLVGLRPLSREFLLHYPDDWRKERLTIRPGIIPPYYADCPQSFEGIIESEKKYMRLKKRYPVTTDIFYLFRVLLNFIAGRARTG